MQARYCACMASPVLGIDLGTTNSVVAYADETRVRVLRDEEGRLLTPSTVSFPESGEIKVGQSARDMRLIDAHNTVFSVKRLIGRPFRSPEVRLASKQLPFKLEEGSTGGVVVRVHDETFSLPEISSFILRRLRDIAEGALGQPCQNAVVTVPANFNELQRMATRDAGRIAGLNVLRILNEPTAAALAYGYRAQQQQRIAVYDFGGGTFDISILELSGDVIEVVATAGDTHLGGDDLDRAIADRMAAEFQRQHSLDLKESPEAYGRLAMAAEWIKCQLTEREAAEATIKRLAMQDGAALDLKFRLGQSDFQSLASPLIQRTFTICEDALRLANVRPSQLDAVLLVGGQTRTPRVRELVREFFGMEPKYSVDPDLAVAHGAALQGYALAGVPAAEPEKRVRTLAGAGGAQPADNPWADEPTRVNGPEELAESERKARRSDNPFEEQPNTLPHQNKAKPVQARLPSLRPERPAVLHVQTLSGVGKDAEPAADSGIQTESDSDVPAALRTEEEADEEAKTSTLLDSPKAKLRARTGAAAVCARPKPPMALLEARRLAEEGDVEAALELYGDLLLRDPNDPLLLAEARALRTQLKAAQSSQPPAARKPAQPPPPPPPRSRKPSPEPAVRARSITPPETPGARALSVPLPMAASPSQPVQRRPTAPPPAQERISNTAVSRWSAAPVGADPIALSSLHVVPAAEENDVGSQFPAPPSVAPLLLDVTPHTLCVETVGGFCEQIIERNAPIPTEQTRLFTTSRDNQVVVSVRVCQGESRRTESNQVLGQVELLGLRPGRRGEVNIAVTFVIDADGTLNVRAVDEATGRGQDLRVSLTGAIEPDELERLRLRMRSLAS